MREYWNTLTVLKKIKFALSMVLFVLVVLFAYQNWEVNNLNLLFFSIHIPLTLLIAISMFIGYSISTFVDYKNIVSNEKEIKALKTRIKELHEKNDK